MFLGVLGVNQEPNIHLLLALGDKMQILDFGYTHLDLGSLGQ